MLQRFSILLALSMSIHSRIARPLVSPSIKFIPIEKSISKVKNEVRPINKRNKNIRPSGMLVYDVTDKKMVQSRGENNKITPASLTKIMTLYSLAKALESKKVSLNDKITISRKASFQPPAKLGLKAGEKISVEQALKAMMILSSNDVAYAIGEHLFNDNVSANFNRYAKELNMTSTYFGNATGLHHQQQVSTPKDILKLVIALKRFYPKYLDLSSGEKFCWKGNCRRATNKLVGQVQGVTGLKTGYLNSCGYHLVTYSKVANKEFVGVFMGHGSSYERNNFASQIVKNYNRKLFTHPTLAINADLKHSQITSMAKETKDFNLSEIFKMIGLKEKSVKKVVKKTAIKKIVKKSVKAKVAKKTPVKNHNAFIKSLLN